MMADTLNDRVRERLLSGEVDEDLLARALADAVRPDSDVADLFLEDRIDETWRLADGRIDGGSYARSGGFGLRAVAGARTAFAHAGDVSRATLADAVAAVRGGSAGAAVAPPVRTSGPVAALYDMIDPPSDWSMARKVALLGEVDARARARDPRVVNVFATLSLSSQAVMILREDGRVATDLRPLVQLNVHVLAEADGRREGGDGAVGGRYSADLVEERLDACIDTAVRVAVTNLDARPAPGGTMPVVLAPGYPGVLFHEAVGHGLEGDFIRKRLSAFSGRLGERVAAPGVTVVDDGAIRSARGSLAIDDEGEATRATTLVDDGILVGAMQDRVNAGLSNARPTGNGRRQSYAHLPLPRMTNTFLAAGSHGPAEIVASVDRGIFAVEFGGGEVNIVSGRFSFSTTLAFLIEGGRITAPIKGATLIGHGPTSLRGIAMVGNDFALEPGTAVCGKAGQTLPVSVGQPTLRIDDMLVGGAA